MDSDVDSDTIEQLVELLNIPAECNRYENITEESTLQTLSEWRRAVSLTLTRLSDQVTKALHVKCEETKSKVIAAVAAFDGEDEWIDTTMRAQARGLLDRLYNNEYLILQLVLTEKVRPIFRENLHPSLHARSSRRVVHPFKGSMTTQGLFVEQTWKNHAGIWNVVSWCIRNTTSSYYSTLWHLIIPPVMTFLDDYEVKYRLKGAQLTLQMLAAVSKDILGRTGIGELILGSLSTSLSYLHDTKSPLLIRTVIPTAIKVISMTATDEAKKFELLCAILGESVIGGIWIYASRDLETIEASLKTIPELLRALGFGSIRYMKGLMHECLFCITIEHTTTVPISLRLAAFKALLSVINECSARVHRWKGTIISGICKGWIIIHEGAGSEKIESQIQPLDGAITLIQSQKLECQIVTADIFKRIAQICPGVIEDEYHRIKESGPAALTTLLP